MKNIKCYDFETREIDGEFKFIKEILYEEIPQRNDFINYEFNKIKILLEKNNPMKKEKVI